MHVVTPKDIAAYLRDDPVAKWLDRVSGPDDEHLTCQRWLRQSEPKRYIFNRLYGPLLLASDRKSIVDVGGGVTAFTRQLARTHDYSLVDIMAHDADVSVARLHAEIGRDFIYTQDWAALKHPEADVVIANDIFPNVDQRLDLFLQCWLPHSQRVLLSLTFYEEPRYYFAKRLDGEEVFCFLAWDGAHTLSVLRKYADRIEGFDEAAFHALPPSSYANGRQVCIVGIAGDLSRR